VVQVSVVVIYVIIWILNVRIAIYVWQKDQLAQHETYLYQIESDLADHIKYPPERGAKSRIIHDYLEKENFLQFEVSFNFHDITYW